MQALLTRRNLRVTYAALTSLLIAAIVLESIDHGFHWQLPVFAWAPDLALLYGVGRGLAKGQLSPRAVPFYNAVHRFTPPLVLAAAAGAFDLGAAWFIGALAWMFHVALDRTVGYGLRTAEGFQRA